MGPDAVKASCDPARHGPNCRPECKYTLNYDHGQLKAAECLAASWLYAGLAVDEKGAHLATLVDKKTWPRTAHVFVFHVVVHVVEQQHLDN